MLLTLLAAFNTMCFDMYTYMYIHVYLPAMHTRSRIVSPSYNTIVNTYQHSSRSVLARHGLLCQYRDYNSRFHSIGKVE